MATLLENIGNCNVDVCGDGSVSTLPVANIYECGILQLLGGAYKMFLIDKDNPIEIPISEATNMDTLATASRVALLARVDNNSTAKTAIRELKVIASKGDPTTTETDSTPWTPASTNIESMTYSVQVVDNTEQNYNLLRGIQKGGSSFNCFAVFCTEQHYYGITEGGIQGAISNVRYIIPEASTDEQQLLFDFVATICVEPSRVPVDNEIITTHLSAGKQGTATLIDEITEYLAESPAISIQSVTADTNQVTVNVKDGVAFDSIQISKRTSAGVTSPYEEAGHSGTATTLAEMNTAISNGTTTGFTLTSTSYTFAATDTVLIKYQLTGESAFENVDEFEVTA